MPATADSGDGKLLKNSSNYFPKDIYIYIYIYNVFVFWDVKCNRSVHCSQYTCFRSNLIEK